MSRPLLVVEDEERVADFVSRGLRAEGYAVTLARSGLEALEAAREGGFVAIVLDVMLPGRSGLEVCQTLRAQGNLTPILLLTARDAIEDRVEGLNAGADDYLTKPFAFDELLARVAALIRRSHNFAGAKAQLEVGDLRLDRETLGVVRGDQAVELTAKEFALLELFMSSPGRVLSRARILSNVWGYSADPLTNVVDVYVRRLRRKLGDDEGRLIATLRGSGYRLVQSTHDSKAPASS